jgi:hypothetical protein
LHDSFCGFSIQSWNCNLKLYRKRVGARISEPEGDPRGDPRLACVDAEPPPCLGHCALEARAVTQGKELLRICAAALSAQWDGQAQI